MVSPLIVLDVLIIIGFASCAVNVLRDPGWPELDSSAYPGLQDEIRKVMALRKPDIVVGPVIKAERVVLASTTDHESMQWVKFQSNDMTCAIIMKTTVSPLGTGVVTTVQDKMMCTNTNEFIPV